MRRAQLSTTLFLSILASLVAIPMGCERREEGSGQYERRRTQERRTETQRQTPPAREAQPDMQQRDATGTRPE